MLFEYFVSNYINDVMSATQLTVNVVINKSSNKSLQILSLWMYNAKKNIVLIIEYLNKLIYGYVLAIILDLHIINNKINIILFKYSCFLDTSIYNKFF